MKRLLPALLLWLAGCSAQALDPVPPGDVLRLIVQANAAGDAISARVQTSGGYGCGAALPVRAGRNSALMYLDVMGVDPGTAGCPGETARSRTVTFSRITNRVMLLEVWTGGRKDRYTLTADGARRWTVVPIEGVFSRIVLAQD